MIPIKRSLGGGATLSVLPTTRFKSGLLSITMAVPMNAKNACLAPLMLSVLHRGTKSFPTLADINRRLDYLFGTGFSIVNYTKGDWLILGFSAELLDSIYLPKDSEDITDGVLDLMREMLFFPALDADGLLSKKYVESEKIQQCDAIRATVNNPRAYAVERCKQLVFASQPAGLPLYGTEEETMAVTREELTEYWKNWKEAFCPSCFYIGSLEQDVLQEKINRAFGFDQRAPEAVCLPKQTAVGAKDLQKTEETLAVSQGHLLMAYRTGVLLNSEEFYPMTVMSALLGGTPVSRLFTQVREKLSLCYTCSASYNAFKGSVVCYCGLDVQNRQKAEEAIAQQVEVLKSGQFQEGELEAAKRYLINSYRQMDDSPAGLEHYFSGRALMGVNAELSECMEQISRVTGEDIVRVANLLIPDTVYFLRGTLPGKGEEEDD